MTGADGIHPGYGFLSENEEFAQKCEEAGITFIGPTVKQLQMFGDKIEAKEDQKLLLQGLFFVSLKYSSPSPKRSSKRSYLSPHRR